MFALLIKGALCRFGEEIKTKNFKINYINEVIIQTRNYFFFSISE